MIEPTLPRFCTEVPWRSEPVKLHKTLGHARAAITNSLWEPAPNDFYIKEWVDNQWQTVEKGYAGWNEDDLPWRDPPLEPVSDGYQVTISTVNTWGYSGVQQSIRVHNLQDLKAAFAEVEAWMIEQESNE